MAPTRSERGKVITNTIAWPDIAWSDGKGRFIMHVPSGTEMAAGNAFLSTFRHDHNKCFAIVGTRQGSTQHALEVEVTRRRLR